MSAIRQHCKKYTHNESAAYRNVQHWPIVPAESGVAQQKPDPYQLRLARPFQKGRIQVFDINGKYLKEAFLSKDLANEPRVFCDPQQQFLYVTDFRQQILHILFF
jgi:hypothetical protein